MSGYLSGSSSEPEAPELTCATARPIVDTGKGTRSVTNDIEAVVRKIEYWHQGSIAAFKISYRDKDGVWDGVR